jgi:hypothetical protein
MVLPVRSCAAAIRPDRERDWRARSAGRFEGPCNEGQVPARVPINARNSVQARGGHALAYVVGEFDAGKAFTDQALLINPNFAVGWMLSGRPCASACQEHGGLETNGRRERILGLSRCGSPEVRARRPVLIGDFCGFTSQWRIFVAVGLAEGVGFEPLVR